MVAESLSRQRRTVHLKTGGHEPGPSLARDHVQDPGLAGGREAGRTLVDETNPSPSQDQDPSPSQDPGQSPGQDLVPGPSLSQM